MGNNLEAGEDFQKASNRYLSSALSPVYCFAQHGFIQPEIYRGNFGLSSLPTDTTGVPTHRLRCDPSSPATTSHRHPRWPQHPSLSPSSLLPSQPRCSTPGRAGAAVPGSASRGQQRPTPERTYREGFGLTGRADTHGLALATRL